MALRTRDATDDASTGEELYETRTSRETEGVDGGTITWEVVEEKRRCGWIATERTLSTVDVDDVAAMRQALQKRGLDTGAVYHERA